MSLLPIALCMGEINCELVHLFVKFAVRYIPFKNKEDIQSNDFFKQVLKVSNEVIRNPDYDYLTELSTFLNDKVDPQVNPNNFIETVCQRVLTNDEAKSLLAFIECSECKQHDIQVTDIQKLSLEHIIPQSTISTNTEKIIKSLGNTTLLEHGYNFRLKDKQYIKKKEQYSKSDSHLTCEVAEDYETFTREQAIERTQDLALRLEEACRYFDVVEEQDLDIDEESEVELEVGGTYYEEETDYEEEAVLDLELHNEVELCAESY